MQYLSGGKLSVCIGIYENLRCKVKVVVCGPGKNTSNLQYLVISHYKQRLNS